MALPFLQILGAVGSVMSVASTVAAGDAARQQAESKAKEAEEDRRRNKLKFAQLHTGRDKGTDRSLRAFRRKQEETVGKDITRMDRQALFTDDKFRRQAEQFRIEGEAKQRAYYLRAVSQGIQSFYNLNKTSV